LVLLVLSDDLARFCGDGAFLQSAFSFFSSGGTTPDPSSSFLFGVDFCVDLTFGVMDSFKSFSQGVVVGVDGGVAVGVAVSPVVLRRPFRVLAPRAATGDLPQLELSPPK